MDEIVATPQRKINPKIVLIILAVIILAEVIFAVKTLTEPIPKFSFSDGKITLNKPNIALLLAKSEYNVGENLAIGIRVDTNGRKTSGTDVLMRFDPKFIEATGSGVIVKGTIYQDYPALNVDQNTGLITVSGISTAPDSGFTGKGILATINLKTKAPGETRVTMDYDPTSQVDSNIIDAVTGRDILRKVIPLRITIK